MSQKACICFYGLVHRSLKFTIDSIQKHIFDVLKKENIEYDVYIHTFDTTVATGTRNGSDNNTPIDVKDCNLLNPCVLQIESEEEFNKNFDWKSVEKYKDPWNNKFMSLRNMIRELHSCNKVFISTQQKKYDFYIFTRADIRWIKDVVVPSENELIISHGFVNDLCAIGKYNAIKHWASRINSIHKFRGTHAESLVNFITKQNKLKTKTVSVSRVRATGQVV